MVKRLNLTCRMLVFFNQFYFFKSLSTHIVDNISVADPGFPSGWFPNARSFGGENCMKMKEIG